MQERLLKTMLVCSILFSAVSMSVMLYFSATKTIVITEEALPEQSADRGKIPSGRQNRLQLLKSEIEKGVEIPLPSEIRADDIVIENRYIENSIHIILTGKYSTFYRENELLVNGEVVEDGFFSEENGMTRLQLEMKGLYEHQYMFENGVLQLSFAKPSDLYDQIVVLDAACGGTDSGHTGNGIREKDITLQVTEKVREKLKDTGIRVYCTRVDDVTVAEEERVRFANELSADLLISVRAGADKSNEKVYGIQSFYNGTYFIPYFGNIQLADLLERNTVTAVGGKANGLFEASGEDVVLQGVQMPAAAIEVGYLTNKEETGKLALPEYTDKLAEGIAATINEAFGKIDLNP